MNDNSPKNANIVAGTQASDWLIITMPARKGFDANEAGKAQRKTMYAPTARAADTHQGESNNTSLSDGSFLLRPIDPTSFIVLCSCEAALGPKPAPPPLRI
ncbi:hypothetical protein GCM10009080_44950 [Cupriavidus pauculus]